LAPAAGTKAATEAAARTAIAEWRSARVIVWFPGLLCISS
jgi:hypothetical protein